MEDVANSKRRWSIDMSDEHRAKLVELQKRFKITQGEVVEVLLDFAGDSDQIEPAMQAKREAKVARRAPKKELYQQFKNLTPEQLAAALAHAQTLSAAAK